MTLDLSTPEAAINSYIACCRSGNANGLQQLFHVQASMYGYLKGQLVTGGPRMFFDTVAAAPAPETSGEPYTATIIYSHSAGDTASVIMTEDDYLGMNFVNHFHLLRVEGRWLIVSKLFQSKS